MSCVHKTCYVNAYWVCLLQLLLVFISSAVNTGGSVGREMGPTWTGAAGSSAALVRTVLSRRSEQHGPEESLCGRRVKRGCRRRGRGRHARMTRNGRVCARPSESSGEGCVAGLPGLAACECGSAAGRAPARGVLRPPSPRLAKPTLPSEHRGPSPGGLDLP